MSAVYNDGSLTYGSATLTFTPSAGGSTFTGIADPDWSLTSGTKEVDQTDASGEPSKSFGIPLNPSGSCVVQVGTTAPARGDTFTSDKTSTTVYIVTSSRPIYAKEDYLKVEISYRKKINA